MCNICAAFHPSLTDCEYKSLGMMPPDADTETSGGPITPVDSQGTNGTVTEGADAPASVSTPYAMDVGDTFNGTLSTLGDRDWVEINLTAGQTYVFAVNGNGGSALSDSVVRLRDADGTSIALNDDAGAGFQASLGFTATTTGTYYIDVGGYADNRTGGYSLTATVAASSAPLGTHDQLATYLTDGYWNDTGRSAAAFDTSTDNTITVDISRLTLEGQRLAIWSFQAFEQIIDVTFDVIVGPADGIGRADIKFDDNQSGAFASSSTNGAGTIRNSDVNISTAWLSSSGIEINSYSFQTYMHEIGHALGLGHQGNYNGNATFGVDETFRNDSWLMSMMSYFNQDESLYTGSSSATTISPMLIDVIALQSMYGAADAVSSPTAGNTVYGVGHTFANAFAGTDINGYGSYLATIFDFMTTGLDPNNYLNNTDMAFTITDAGGIDTIDFSTDTSNQFVSLLEETLSTVFSSFGDGRNDNMWIARGTTIENYTAGLGDDHVTGNAVGNALRGNAGADTLNGMAGNDLLHGGAGADSLDGGADSDTVSYDGSNASVIVNLNTGAAVGGHADGDTLTNIEHVIGSNLNDTIYGDDATGNILNGGGGADLLAGLAGNDTLNGGDGEDALSGGNNNDELNGGADNDRLFGNNGNDLINGDAGDDYTNGGAGNDTINGGADDDNVLVGGSGNDLIYGDGGADGLNGSFDNDTLHGGDGDDRLYGADGFDLLFGGNDNDTLGGNDGGDDLRGGSGNDGLNGGTGDDVLFGEAGQDRLYGSLGADTLNGGAGDDLLVGQGGVDTFVFDENWGNDQISGYGVDVTGQPRVDEIIDLSALAITFADLTIQQTGVHTLVYVTADGSTNNSIEILFRSASEITADDFIFV